VRTRIVDIPATTTAAAIAVVATVAAVVQNGILQYYTAFTADKIIPKSEMNIKHKLHSVFMMLWH
jgi:hypothetical protein